MRDIVVLLKNCARYIQIHSLVHKMAANRNEDGTLKSLWFGGAQRLRVSSQSRKSTMRYCEDPELGLRHIQLPLGGNVAVSNPSRGHFERVMAGLPKDGADERTRMLIVRAVYDTVVGTKSAETKADNKKSDAEARLTAAKEALAKVEQEVEAAAKDKDNKLDAKAKRTLDTKLKKAQDAVDRSGVAFHNAGGEVDLDEEQAQAAQAKIDSGTDQVMILSDHEDKLLVELTTASLKALAKGDEKSYHKVVKEVVREWKSKHGDEFRSMQLGCGIESAVFGRPVYGGGLFQQSPAAVGAAHELSVHEQRIAYDTFTAIDVFKRDAGEMGAGMLGELPLSSGLFYGYMFIDTRLLIENIERNPTDSAIAAEVVRRLILLTARMSSKTKRGSLAAMHHALLTLVEVGDGQPSTFADAFMEPVTVDRERPNMLVNTYNRLATYIEATDRAHPTTNKRAMAFVDMTKQSTLPAVVPTILSDNGVAEWSVTTANHQVYAGPTLDAQEHAATPAKNGSKATAPAAAPAE